MYYLLLTITLNVVISVILKLFPRYNINSLQAIVFNYWVCVITGSIFMGHCPINMSNTQQAWFPWSVLMGLGFITVFNLMAYCARVYGITTLTVANKLSLVIPVLFAVFMYSERVNVINASGILLAFPAVYMASHVAGGDKKQSNLLWPAALFVLSGSLDTLVKFVERNYLPTSDVQAVFTIHVFAIAGVFGAIIMVVMALMKKITLQWRNVLAGICIGIPNYFSIYYFIRMLNSGFMQSSAAIPVNNIAILVVSSLVALLLFKEKGTVVRIIGIVLSVIAILLIALGDLYGGGITI